MTRILIDTSVWIEFFSSKPSVSKQLLDRLTQHILEGEVAIIEPIRVELLSGVIRSSAKAEVARLLGSLEKVDLDWNSKENWDKLIELSSVAHAHKCSVPGVVDRMILLSAKEASVTLLTKDRLLGKLAAILEVEIFEQ